MSYVAVYPVTSPDTPNKVLTHADDIAATLAEHGVRFERWQPASIEQGASDAQMIAAYQAQIDALGYERVDVFSVTGDHPQKTHCARSSSMSAVTLTKKCASLLPAKACTPCTLATMCTPYVAKSMTC